MDPLTRIMRCENCKKQTIHRLVNTVYQINNSRFRLFDCEVCGARAKKLTSGGAIVRLQRSIYGDKSHYDTEESF